ncbi:hypothetical protein OG705_29015 [Streptomyces sp. NBC_00838]|uniref:hypothetical protein n=1 Tax=Streptomyces sp. NBC_00838 TaxID=2903680 RepID=UPI00386ADEA1|nr:hypothetical protein OG705_29015 [Streptomyces sp. NBC_00838]
MLAVSQRVPGHGRTPDQTIWHKSAPGHRCTGRCDFHPIACSTDEGIIFPATKQDVPIRLEKEHEAWCGDCLVIIRQQRTATTQEPTR